jgi:FecR protein
MKTVIILFFSFCFSLNLFAFSGRHDSLLFDGGNDIQGLKFITDDTDCGVEAEEVKGEVYGTVRVRKMMVKECGGEEVPVTVTEKRLIKKGDILQLGEEIITGENAGLTLSDANASVIKLGPKTILEITPDEFCTGKTFISVKAGKVWSKVKKLFGGGRFEVSTPFAGVGVRGTEFTVETDGTTDIIRVYEGIVEVKKMIFTEDSTEKDLEQNASDFEQGKITMEEYAQRLMIITKAANQNLKEYIQPIGLNAGYQITITKENITGPETITGDDGWWKNE